MAKKDQTTILFVTDRSVSVHGEKTKAKLFLFPIELAEGGKIKDKQAFTAFLTQELEDVLKKSKTCLIILGRGVLYQVAVEKDTSGQDKTLQAFFQALPFGPQNALQKTIRTEKKDYLLVTNKDYVTALLDALHSLQKQVLAVVPLSLFSDDVDQEELSPELVKEVMNKQALFSSGDFLADSQSQDDVVDQPEEEKQTFVEPERGEVYTRETSLNGFRIVVIIAVLAFAVLAVALGIFRLHHQIATVPVQNTPTVTVTPTPTPAITKDQLKVQVLNGTGQAGQAGRVKDTLQALSFTSVDTGNAEVDDTTDTIVTFSARVSDQIQKEVTEALKKTFTNVVTHTATDAKPSFDISITTGTEK